MSGIKYFTRGEDGEKIIHEVADQKSVDEVKERMDDVVAEVPYFQQAATLVLTAEDNAQSYPKTMQVLRETAKECRERKEFEELTAGKKAKALAEETAKKLGFKV